jgi:mono/diheme cytochrome c family protein
MATMRYTFFVLLAAAAVIAASSCQQPGGNKTGSEYMPDMAHSTAYEANVYAEYTRNTWDSASVFPRKALSEPRKPVTGTIPRGYAGHFFAMDDESRKGVMAVLTGQDGRSISTPINGHVPYYYGNTEEERARATAEITSNPFPLTDVGLAKGKELYTIFCATCHGDKGDGAGYLVRDPNPAKGDLGGVYPAAPTNFLLDDLKNSGEGRYYHAIMYGRNVMGAYADKLSYEERWQVIHYIRSLQGKTE